MKKIMLARELHPVFLSAVHYLHRSDLAVHTVDTADEMLKAHFEHRASLIVTTPELGGMHCETMINVIRRNEALKSVSIMVLYKDDPVQHARSTGCGANITVALPADPALLASHISQLLSVEPRRSYQVVLNMALDGGLHKKTFLCKSENISPRGLLVRTSEVLAPGSRVACSFRLPDGTRVSAEGDVARVITREPGDVVHQYGVRFLNLAPQAQSAISSFVHR